MRPSRGMGAMNPSKMPGGRKVARKDNPGTIDVYAKGGAILKKKRPPHKPAKPQLGKPLRNFRDSIPPTKFT